MLQPDPLRLYSVKQFAMGSLESLIEVNLMVFSVYASRRIHEKTEFSLNRGQYGAKRRQYTAKREMASKLTYPKRLRRDA